MTVLPTALRHLLAEFLFAAFARFLATLPATWFVYAFVFTIIRCEPSLSLRCLKIGLGAPVGLVVMLGLAVEEKYDEPDCVVVWLIAAAVAFLWAAISGAVQRQRQRRHRN